MTFPTCDGPVCRGRRAKWLAVNSQTSKPRNWPGRRGQSGWKSPCLSFSAPLASEQQSSWHFSLCEWARMWSLSQWSPVDATGYIKKLSSQFLSFSRAKCFFFFSLALLGRCHVAFCHSARQLPTMFCLWLQEPVLRSSGQ